MLTKINKKYACVRCGVGEGRAGTAWTVRGMAAAKTLGRHLSGVVVFGEVWAEQVAREVRSGGAGL